LKLTPLDLQSRKKWTMSGTSRVKPVEQTLKEVLPLTEKIGVTRLADITDMDILKIPNYSAVLPGTDDYIWVYSCKGLTKHHAQASALMESIERYCSLPSGAPKNMIQGSYDDLSKKFNVLHPSSVVEPMTFQYTDDMVMDFLPGFDLMNKEFLLVPAPIALFKYSARQPAINPFAYHHTNGLASGNVMEEAICHSLCEVIERDAISMAQLKASAVHFHILKTVEHSLNSNGYYVTPITATDYVDDNSIFPDVEINDIEFEPIVRLVTKFQKANIPLIIKNVTSEIGIPTFNAASIEWITHDYGYLVEGHGTHPDARIALLRAITEVSQSRAANIQGARDDLRKIPYGENNTDDQRSWQFMKSRDTIRFSDVKSFINEDILDDIKLILTKFDENDLNQVIVVDLTNLNVGIPVVRTIVPGLEMYKITKSVIGRRGRACFKV
jgi:ribosomal protein S12 methylthiotransferase accessory factor YcaO